MPGTRRILLPKCEYHVYYTIDPKRYEVLVRAIWHSAPWTRARTRPSVRSDPAPVRVRSDWDWRRARNGPPPCCARHTGARGRGSFGQHRCSCRSPRPLLHVAALRSNKRPAPGARSTRGRRTLGADARPPREARTLQRDRHLVEHRRGLLPSHRRLATCGARRREPRSTHFECAVVSSQLRKACSPRSSNRSRAVNPSRKTDCTKSEALCPGGSGRAPKNLRSRGIPRTR